MAKGWIAIFKPGTHTDAAGNTNTWTEDDVKGMVDAYNNQPDDKRHDAPIVKGHPKTDDPAMGWVEKLKYEGGKLWAKLKQVDKKFVEEVRSGMYKKISVRLYPDGKMLRHVGFLGAVPPAIKGLGDAQLCEFPQFNDKESDDFHEDFDLEDISLADTDTVASLKSAQEQRSKKFGIAIQSSRGLATKPEHYSTLKDEDFADPVHYRFPINDIANTIVSMSMFNRYDTRNEYQETERQIIGSRLVDAAIKFQIDDKKRDLFINMYKENNKQQFTNKSGEKKVDEKIKALKDAFIAKLKSETSEEIATRAEKLFNEDRVDTLFMEVFSAPSDSLKQTETNSKEEVNNNPAPKFEESEAFKNLQKENKEIRDKLRMKEFMEFLDSEQVRAKVPPAQRQSKLDLLEMAYQSGIEFSDADGKKFSAVEKVKRDILSTPDVVDLKNLPSITTLNSDFSEEDKEIENYNKSKGR
ncbi:hypothetical protein D9V86_11720 [Bacteroidetes/Chlorobi group bacterium ChocPot_Mid]|nr:MAG: hypothetical protein D9V86_11720 [Bacteroidetes/Chlorobi group bacterium ChocPot_Mid]